MCYICAVEYYFNYVKLLHLFLLPVLVNVRMCSFVNLLIIAFV